jgi:hypothetical protein
MQSGEHNIALNKVDSWDKFESSITKWNFNIYALVMNVDLFQHMKNVPTYKDKWGAILENSKNIFDHMSKTKQNED